MLINFFKCLTVVVAIVFLKVRNQDLLYFLLSENKENKPVYNTEEYQKEKQK